MTDGLGSDAITAVLSWSADHLRDLPWRRTRDPWAIVVSEVMLQQTQVARVLPKYEAFLRQFPTPAACATAPLAGVLRAWHGLGYPIRARRLHELATEVVRLGSFPNTLEGLLRLPGVGPYTARAVLAFAFEADVAVVDTNVGRIHARVAGRRLTSRDVQAAADLSVGEGCGWRWNQTMIELGAVVCRPRRPQCDDCPLQPWCAWRGVGDDPAIGSAAVSTRQPRFSGSDRQARGRVMAAVQAGPVRTDQTEVITGRDLEAAGAIVASLVRDGLLVMDGDSLSLP